MKYFSFLILFLALLRSAFAFEPFVAKDIRLEGLQRIAIGTVFNYLSVKLGIRNKNLCQVFRPSRYLRHVMRAVSRPA